MSETATSPTDWDLVLSGQADWEVKQHVLARSAAEIGAFLDSDEQTEEETLELLRRRLAERLEPNTYDMVLSTLGALVGSDGASLVHWYATTTDSDDLHALDASASPRVLYFLRRIAAAHGPELRAAFALWKEVPNDWRSINREVFFDLMRERHYIRHRIEKVNGEEVLLEGSADSVLDLARGLLTTLRWVGTRDAFSPTAVDVFLEEADAVLGMLRPLEPSGNGDVALAEPERAG